jgi:transposase
MKLHANARLSVKGRELLIDRILAEGWSLAQAAEAAGVSDRTAAKWVARFRREGEPGLLDRSSAPRSSPSRTPDQRVQVIAALRRLRMTGAEIAECVGMAVTTVSGILTRIGMGRLVRLGLEPVVRYERGRPGELIHIDVKKLGRIHAGAGHRVTGKRGRYTGQRTDAEGAVRQIIGWEFVHIAIDDATRLAYVEVLPDEKALTAIAFLRQAVAHYESYVNRRYLFVDTGRREGPEHSKGPGGGAIVASAPATAGDATPTTAAMPAASKNDASKAPQHRLARLALSTVDDLAPPTRIAVESITWVARATTSPVPPRAVSKLTQHSRHFYWLFECKLVRAFESNWTSSFFIADKPSKRCVFRATFEFLYSLSAFLTSLDSEHHFPGCVHNFDWLDFANHTSCDVGFRTTRGEAMHEQKVGTRARLQIKPRLTRGSFGFGDLAEVATEFVHLNFFRTCTRGVNGAFFARFIEFDFTSFQGLVHGSHFFWTADLTGSRTAFAASYFKGTKRV